MLLDEECCLTVSSAFCVSLKRCGENHVDPTEGGDAQYDRQCSEAEERGAGSTGRPRLGCAQRVPRWHDLH